jgi:2-oxoglutarate dehydrogenase E2 component (dihydrolipoamide succinyltransferase)
MALDIVVPALGESISEAVISRWLKKVGEPMAVDEPILELETDKVTVELPSPAAGVLTEQRFGEGATVRIGDVVGQLDPGAKGATASPAPAKAAAPAPAVATTPASATAASAPPAPAAPPTVASGKPATATALTNGVGLSPSARKALREHGAPATSAGPATPAPSTATSAPRAAAAELGPREQIVAMTPLRKRIAERLVAAQHTAAVLTTFNEVDMTEVMALRERQQDSFTKKHGVKLGFMSLFTRAAVAALKDFPGLNAEVRGDSIVYKHHYDIGIAVGSGRGLVVPVLRDADQLSFAEIERGIATLAGKARDNKLTLDELTGGTFTITNGGIYGSMLSTPLLNLPQTAILGMHNIQKRAIVVGDQIQIRPMMYLALSYDHRVVDGREAVQFLVGLKQRLEQPERLLVDL